MHIAVVVAAIVIALASATRVQRSEPGDWFRDLVLADQEVGTHDHSGATEQRLDHLCCHWIDFTNDPSSDTDLFNLVVPYNHWWAPGDVLLALTNTLEEPTPRFLTIGDHGLVVDLREHSRAYLRIQCAYSCCLELAELVRPIGAHVIIIEAGLLGSDEVAPTPVRHDIAHRIPAGYVALGAHTTDNEVRDQYVWLTPGTNAERAQSQQLCDTETRGIWVSITSPSRVQLTLSQLSVCFRDHDLERSWDHGMCEEPL